jgi:hypothetical protein
MSATSDEAAEPEVTMAGSIRTMRGIGKQVVDIFEDAGYMMIVQLENFNGDDRRLWTAIQAKKDAGDHAFPDSYWRRLMTRCINIIYRARSAKATDYVPAEYMCPLTLDWFEDPVVTASGHSYSRAGIEEHLEESALDPMTRKEIRGMPLYPNIALRAAVDHYRLHFQCFRILD